MADLAGKSIEQYLLECDMKGIKCFVHPICMGSVKNQEVLSMLENIPRIYAAGPGFNGRHICYILSTKLISQMVEKPWPHMKWIIDEKGMSLIYGRNEVIFKYVNHWNSESEKFKKQIEMDIYAKESEIENCKEMLAKIVEQENHGL